MVGVPAQGTFGQFHRLQGQGGQALLHHRLTSQQPEQFGALTSDIGQGIEQIEHAATFGEQRLAGVMMGANGCEHRRVGRQGPVMQLRVTTGQVQAVGLRQTGVMQRREERQLRAHGPQQVEVGAIGEGKGFVAGDRDAHALQQGLAHKLGRRGETHRRRQSRVATGAQGGCSCIQACFEVVQFTGLDQAQVAARQFDAGFSRQPAVPAQPFGQAAFEQLSVAQGTDAVGQHPGKRQVRLIARQAQGQGTEGLGHGRAIDHRQHRHTKMTSKVGARWRAIEQPHDPFDQDQVGLSRRFP
ncbi:hypothetical protein D3C79_712320 [compost metagenome]